jgi:hypothetical protein
MISRTVAIRNSASRRSPNVTEMDPAADRTVTKTAMSTSP